MAIIVEVCLGAAIAVSSAGEEKTRNDAPVLVKANSSGVYIYCHMLTYKHHSLCIMIVKSPSSGAVSLRQ